MTHMPKLWIRDKGGSNITIHLDDEDITNSLDHIVIERDARDPRATVTISLPIVELDNELGEPKIVMAAQSAELLKRLGWTSPPEPDKAPEANSDPQVIRDAGYEPIQIGVNPDVAPLYAPGSKLPPEAP